MRSERLWQRAQQYIADDQLDAAQVSLQSLLQRDPVNVQAHMLLSSVALGRGQLREGCAHALDAARHLPDDPEQIAVIAHCLFRIGETRAAHTCMAHAAVHTCQSGSALNQIAHIHQLLGDHPQALQFMNLALARGFDNPEFRYFRALQLQFNGHLPEAEAEMDKALDHGTTIGRASLALARMHRQNHDNNHLEMIASRLNQVAQGSEDHAALEFARYQEFDDLDNREQAWLALSQGNAIMHKHLPHDIEQERLLFRELLQFKITDDLPSAAKRATMSGPTPVFILGMPRSGTTLLEQLLGNHSRIATPGELPDFPKQLRWVTNQHGAGLLDPSVLESLQDIDFAQLGQRYLQQSQWRAGDQPFYIDKLPANFMLAGLIHRALPQAPILHMVRDSMDLVYSNLRAFFGDSSIYSYDLEALARHISRYHALMQHWHQTMPGVIHDVGYADLVIHPEPTLRHALEYCGLELEPACLDTTHAVRPVATLSSPQIREGIHQRGLGGWRRYAEQLEPARVILNQPVDIRN